MLHARLRAAKGNGVLTGDVARARRGIGAVPPTINLLLAIASVQFGAAVAKHLFDRVGPAGTAAVRVGFAAIALLIWWRPRVRGFQRADFGTIALFGLVLGAMNLVFYSALARLPLGIAVALEFLGPLGVALAGSRRVRDVLWALLAAVGILLLSPIGQDIAGRLNLLGVVFALLSAVCWAGYILLGSRVGKIAPGGGGLAMAMTVGAIVLVPVGIATAGTSLLDPGLLLAGGAVALLSSALPYTLEIEALRHLPTRIFGVLMSIEPVIAALIGFVVLREALGPRAIAAIFLITIAAIGASQSQTGASPPLEQV